MKNIIFGLDTWMYHHKTAHAAAKATLKDLVAALQHYPLMTHSGQTVTFEIDKYGHLRFSIDCKPEEFDELMAQRAARVQAEKVKADAVKVARAALKEAKSRDYSEEGMKRTFGLDK